VVQNFESESVLRFAIHLYILQNFLALQNPDYQPVEVRLYQKHTSHFDADLDDQNHSHLDEDLGHLNYLCRLLFFVFLFQKLDIV